MWQIKRSDFNHDWLKNKYINHLRAFVQRCENGDLSEDDLHSFYAEDFPQWKYQFPVLIELCRTFHSEMSPKLLCNNEVLDGLEPGVQEFLAQVTDFIWWQEKRELLLSVKECSENVQSEFKKSERVFDRTITLKEVDIKKLEQTIKNLMVKCQQLASSIGRLPSKVTVL